MLHDEVELNIGTTTTPTATPISSMARLLNLLVLLLLPQLL